MCIFFFYYLNEHVGVSDNGTNYENPIGRPDYC